jgi:hypothetical protein
LVARGIDARFARFSSPTLALLASGTPMLSAESASSADVVTIRTRGHVGKQAKFTNHVVYRTRDGARRGGRASSGCPAVEPQ